MTVKRAPWFVATGAITGFLGIIAFHVGGAAPLAAAPPAPGSTGSTGSSGSTGSTGSTGTSGSTAPASGAGPSASGKPSGAAAAAPRAATGPSVNFSYGTIAVRVTARGGRIVAVSVASLSTLEPTSQQISSQAIPVLRSEVLSAQSASISGVSGATYTSQGFLSSLQAALNDLRS